MLTTLYLTSFVSLVGLRVLLSSSSARKPVVASIAVAGSEARGGFCQSFKRGLAAAISEGGTSCGRQSRLSARRHRRASSRRNPGRNCHRQSPRGGGVVDSRRSDLSHSAEHGARSCVAGGPSVDLLNPRACASRWINLIRS